MPPPQLERDVLVSSEAAAAAEISSLYASPNTYFPVFAADWPDDSEFSELRFNQTANAIALTLPERVLVHGLSSEQTVRLRDHFSEPELPMIPIERLPAIDAISWGPERLATGLLLAKRTGARLVIDLAESPDATSVVDGRDHLVVCEQTDDIMDVIVANYAFAIGADLQLIPPWLRQEVTEIAERLFALSPGASPADALRHAVGSRLPKLEIGRYETITFFTLGVPWGLVFPERPSAHMFLHPRLGRVVASAIARERRDQSRTSAALLIDPAVSGSTETGDAAELLKERHTLVKILAGNDATRSQFDLHLNHFPYDLLLIATHAGEIGGHRLKYEIKMATDKKHELILDQATAFKFEPGSDLVGVVQFTRFVSVDGVPWTDNETKSRLGLGEVATRYVELANLDSSTEDLVLLSEEPIERVRFAMALEASDGAYFIMSNELAAGRNPVILNNSCNSWREMAGIMVAGGARACVSTVCPVLSAEAKQVALKLLAEAHTDELAVALWATQNEVYSDSRRPYILFGPHFSSVPLGDAGALHDVLKSLERDTATWEKRSAAEPGNERLRQAAKYCREEAAALRAFARRSGLRQQR